MPEEYAGRKFSTIFIDGDVPDASGIIQAGKKLAALGITPGFAGNISVRLPEGILITAGGSPLSSLTGSDIVLVASFDEGIATAIGKKEPSSELPMHSRIYSCSSCRAIIHAHDDYLLSNAASLGIPVAPFAPYGTNELALNACEALKGSDLIALENHGIVSVGESLDAALANIVEKRAKMEGPGKKARSYKK